MQRAFLTQRKNPATTNFRMSTIAAQLVAFLLTYWVASDALCLLALRALAPEDTNDQREIFLLSRGVGPIAISWLLFHLLLLLPHHQPSVYIGAILSAVLLAILLGQQQIGCLGRIYIGLWKALPSCWPPSTRGRVLLCLAVGIALFMIAIGVGFPIVGADSLGFAMEARLIHRDLGFDNYPTFVADPQTGYYYSTFQIPCLQSLYVWFSLLSGTSAIDVLPRTVAPMYSLYCAVLVFWLLWRRTQRVDTAWWGVVVLLSLPVFVVHSYLNNQDPHRICLSLSALLCLAALLRQPSHAKAVALGVLLGFSVFAHFLGFVTVVAVGMLCLLLSRQGLRARLATLLLVGVVATPLSGLFYYGVGAGPNDQAASGRLMRQLEFTGGRVVTAPSETGVARAGFDWLLERRGQAGGFGRFIFGILLPFTGIEWFGFSFWLFAVAIAHWLRQPGKTTLEIIMVWVAAAFLAVVLSGVRTLSWSNPRYVGTLAPIVAYFVGAWAATWSGDRWPRAAALVGILLLPLVVTTSVRGAKVGITNPGDFYEKVHSTAWIRAALVDPLGSMQTLWERYFGVRQTLRYAWAGQHEKLLHAHDYFGAVDYMNCCTPADATGLVVGREPYYFYYAQRHGTSLEEPRLQKVWTTADPLEACRVVRGAGVDYVLIDSFYASHPLYVRSRLPAVVADPVLATEVFEGGTARVYRLLCEGCADANCGRPQDHSGSRLQSPMGAYGSG